VSAAKHVLLRVWYRPKDGKESRPSKHALIWTLDRWYAHRTDLMLDQNLTVDEANAKFVITVGGLKRLKLLQASLSRLDNA